MDKIVRSICVFRKRPSPDDREVLRALTGRLRDAGYAVQTQRVCYQELDLVDAARMINDPEVLIGFGGRSLAEGNEIFDTFTQSKQATFHFRLIDEDVAIEHVQYLRRLIAEAPQKTFSFGFQFGDSGSSPYFPSAAYREDGFAVGLQSTDLSVHCATLADWLQRQREVWEEICALFAGEHGFLGIDSSVAPLYEECSSLVGALHKLGYSWNAVILSDVLMQITDFIKRENPKPVGLCGLMLPCLEDFALAERYEQGEFSLERNLFLSMHCGLGIDTYPVGVDESPETILAILRLTQSLARRYNKPLSALFVSDGKAKIGEATQFNNPYLKDVHVRPLALPGVTR